MRFAITDNRTCTDWPETVRVPCCRWRENARRYAQTEPQNRCQRQTIGATKEPFISVTDNMDDSSRKLTTLIPIALRRSLTAWLPPAVSSLEACQTPAR
jgi:hypothetical protein